jgi:hypothetical protein
MKGSWRRRCDAWIGGRGAGKLRGCGPYCRKWAVPGKTRCHLHGGRSTGPKTPEGIAASVAAMQEGRRRRIAELAAEGRKINGGHNGGRYPKEWPMTADGKPVKRENPDPSRAYRLEQARLRWLALQAEARQLKETARLWNLAFRGATNAISRNRDPAVVAAGRAAVAALQALRQKGTTRPK